VADEDVGAQVAQQLVEVELPAVLAGAALQQDLAAAVEAEAPAVERAVGGLVAQRLAPGVEGAADSLRVVGDIGEQTTLDLPPANTPHA